MSASDGQLDSDNDGYSNMEEYFLSSDPRSSSDVPVISEWNTHQGDKGRSGFMPIDLSIDVLSERWRINDMRFETRVVSSGSDVFYKDYNSGSLVKVNIGTGEPVWTYDLGSNRQSTTPLVEDDLVWVQNGSDLRAINADTGSLRYLSSTNSAYYSVSLNRVSDKTISTGSLIYAYSDDGQLDWRYSTGSNNTSSVVEGSNVITVNDDFTVLNGQNGETVLASAPFENSNANHYVMLGSYGNSIVSSNEYLYNVDNATGELLWKKSISAYDPRNMANAFGRVFIAEATLKVYDELSGDLLWSWEAPDRSQLRYNMVVTREYLFVSTSNNTYAISLADQSLAWTFSQPGYKSLQKQGTLFISSYSALIAIDLGFDDDNDGLPNWWESQYGFNLNSALDRLVDGDADGLNNLAEFNAQTNPLVADTDDDGLNDGPEINFYSSDPLNADTDADGLK